MLFSNAVTKKSRGHDVCDGMPVATQNAKDEDIFYTMEFVIQEIKGDRLLTKNQWFGKEEFAKNFFPAFYVTVYKYQDCDLNEDYNVFDANHKDYNVFDANHKDKKQLCSALSRTTKCSLGQQKSE